jgi:hypothetical protein
VPGLALQRPETIGLDVRAHASTLLHSAFYRFVPLADPVAAADALRRWRAS